MREKVDDFFVTSDGVRLHYRVAGEGFPLIFLSGLSGYEELYENNFPVMEEKYRVYYFEYRAHGKSEIPEHGYHIERFAKDLEEFIAFMGLEEFYLISHSMGNAVTWCYMSLFGQEKIKKYILFEEAPCLMADSAWNEEEKDTYLGSFRVDDLWDRSVFGTVERWGCQERMDAIMRLYRDHLVRDWRSEIRQIRVPTLILMGAASHFASPLLWNWLHESVKDSKLIVVSEKDGGTHDIFATGTEVFNKIVMDYLGE